MGTGTLSGIIAWRNPPATPAEPPARDRPSYGWIGSQLRSRPGEWAIVALGRAYWHHAFMREAVQINKNLNAKLRMFGAFEAQAWLIETDTTALFLRYVGPLVKEVSNDDLPTEQHDDDR